MRHGARFRLLVGSLVSIGLLMAGTASAGTSDRIRESGVLRLGYVDGAAPFSYRDETGRPAGYAVDVCEKVASGIQARLGLPQLKTEFVAAPFDQRYALLEQGKVDLLCAAGSITLGLRARVSFSIPVFPSGISALMRQDAPARMRKILSGEPEPYRPRWRASLGQILEKRVFAVIRGSTTEKWLADRIEDFDIIATIDPVDSFDLGVDRVLARRDDVLFGAREILLAAAKRSPSAGDLLVLERQFTYEPLAFSMKRDDEDFRLLVDTVLSSLYRTREIDPIYARYFGEPDEVTRQFFDRTALAD